MSKKSKRAKLKTSSFSHNSLVATWMNQANSQVLKGDYVAAIDTCQRLLSYLPQKSPQRAEVVLATWHIRSEIRHVESDLLVPFCLHEKSGRGRIREHACISYVGTFLSLRKGEACVPFSHPSQATNRSLLSRTSRWHCSLDETALHLSSAWSDRRPRQREA